MRLMVVTNDFPPTVGGIENYTYSLVRRRPPGRVVVVTRWVPGCEEFDSSLGFEVRREPVGTLLPTPGFARRLARMADEEKADAVFFPSGLPLGLLAQRLGRPYAVSIHGGEFMLASRLPGARQALRRLYRGASVLFPESRFAEAIVRRFDDLVAPMVRLPCGVDPDEFSPEGPVAPGLPGGRLIISAGRLIARKGPRSLVAAMPSILRRHPEARLVLVGGGPDLGKLQALARTTGVAGSVVFTGPVTWDQMPSYYRAGEIFALPTRARFAGTETEGLPLVFVEAAACGLPLVGGDAGGVRDAVRPGSTGVLVDGASTSETAGAINALLDDPQQAKRLGAGARMMVEQEFSWDAIHARFEQALATFCA